MANTTSKTFDTSTLKGLKSAERFKARMEREYRRVVTVPVGLFSVRITGSNLPNEWPKVDATATQRAGGSYSVI